jgi:DNA-binding MarR family transcriptional regulator
MTRQVFRYTSPVTRWLTAEEQDAWRGLLVMTSRLEAHLNRQMQDHSRLSLADYAVLVPLSEAPEGRLRIFKVAMSLGWEQSRLSHHLARMSNRGLVDRQECERDRRGAFVVLTPAGREALDRAAPGHVEEVRRLLFDGLPAGELDALRRICDRTLQRLCSSADPPGEAELTPPA